MDNKEKSKVKFLEKNDVFFLEGKVYTVVSNETLSTSFNEIHAICEEEDCNLRLRKNQDITLTEEKIILETSDTAITKTRNERGQLIEVNFGGSNTLTEGPDEWPSRTKRKKITKAQEKKRDDCAEDLMKKPSFNKRYGKKKNVKPPAKSKSDVAYAICSLHATGRDNQINRGRPCKDPPCHKEKKKTNEEFNRLNTLRNAIRRNLNEKI